MLQNFQPWALRWPARPSSKLASTPTIRYSSTSSSKRIHKGLGPLARRGPKAKTRWLKNGRLAATKPATITNQMDAVIDMRAFYFLD